MPTPMTVFDLEGMPVEVPYIPEILAFIHDGDEIRNPFISSCGRFSTDPRDYGFVEYHTGGGCMALRKEWGEGEYLLLTDDDGCSLPNLLLPHVAILGRYREDGEAIAYVTISNIRCVGDIADESNPQ